MVAENQPPVFNTSGNEVAQVGIVVKDAVKTARKFAQLFGIGPWDFFDDPEEPRSLFQTILNDRDLRVDRGISLEDRPPFCVVTSMDGKAVRLEFYEGKIMLRLRYDIRTAELDGAKLPNYLKAHREFLQAEQRFFTPLGAM